MDALLPTRARPVRDPEGRVWWSVARLVVSLFVENKTEFKNLTTSALAQRVEARDTTHSLEPHFDGSICWSVFGDAVLRARAGVVIKKANLSASLLFYAYVSALLLQTTQHPRMQRMLLKAHRRARREHSLGGVLTPASVIYLASVIARRWSRSTTRKQATVALYAIEHFVDTGEECECEMFVIIRKTTFKHKPSV